MSTNNIPQPAATTEQQPTEPRTAKAGTLGPVAPIEAPGLPAALRLSDRPVRHHRIALRNMQGIFLTVLDNEDRILCFAGGAMRRKVNQEMDEVIEMSTRDVLRGVYGVGAASPFQPEYRTRNLRGPSRFQKCEVQFEDLPALTTRIGEVYESATGWGLMWVAVEGFFNGEPICKVQEAKLSQYWDDPQIIEGSVDNNDLSRRLAPDAFDMASVFPSAWTLAVASAKLWGGMTVNAPPTEPIKPAAAVSRMWFEEVALRKEQKAKRDEAARQRRTEASVYSAR